MNKFEAVILISPEISTSIHSSEIDNFKNSITEKGGSIVNQEDWGIRDLSYNIKKFTKAFYMFFQLEADGDILSKINNSLNQNDNILRHLFIKVEDHQELPTKVMNEKK